jgi:hypothetical protein
MIMESFPIWIPILTVIAIILGIWLLKKYDFSYKNNFPVIIIIFIAVIIIAGVLIDILGLNNLWSHQGPMRRFYQKIEGQENNFTKGYGRYYLRNNLNDGYNKNN